MDKELEEAMDRAEYCREKGHCNHRPEDGETYETLNARALCRATEEVTRLRAELAAKARSASVWRAWAWEGARLARVYAPKDQSDRLLMALDQQDALSPKQGEGQDRRDR